MKFIFALVFMVISHTGSAKTHVSFDQMGNMIAPDHKLLMLGKKANKKGHFADANEMFKKAALFGNEQAKVLLANNFINSQNYSSALAWLKLIELKHIENPETITQAIQSLKQILEPQQITASQALFKQLQATYNSQSAQQYRQVWRNKLQFTGTRIRGQVPSQLTVLPVENGTLGINTITITGHEIRAQLNQFVNQYAFDIPMGKVILEPIVSLESNDTH